MAFIFPRKFIRITCTYLQVCVPYKPADLGSLRSTVDAYAWHFSAAQKQWWEDLLQRFADEDAHGCTECSRLRAGMAKNASSKHDDVETARTKGRDRSIYYETMFKHLQEDTENHQKFAGPVFPPVEQRLYTLERIQDAQMPGSLEQAAGEDDPDNIPNEIDNEEDRDVIEKSRRLRQEDTPVFNVAGKAKNSTDNRRPADFEVGHWCIVRNTVHDTTTDPPWYVAIIVDTKAGPLQCEDGGAVDSSTNSIRVHECGFHTTAADPQGATHPTKSKHQPMYKRMIANRGRSSDQDPEFVEQRQYRNVKTSIAVKGWEPVTTQVFGESIGEYGDVKSIIKNNFTLTTKSVKFLNGCASIDWHADNYNDDDSRSAISGAGGAGGKKRKEHPTSSHDETD